MTDIRKWAGLLLLAGAGAASAQGTKGQDRDPYLAMNRQLVGNGCHFCHGADYARVGPAMKDVAMVYAGQGAQGAATIKESIAKGSKGKWGPAMMPAQHQVTPQKADALIAAILALAPKS